MSEPFEKVLAEAKQLSPEERQELVRELTRPESPPTGETTRTLYDALKERGLIGFIDGPPDLSTNLKYMEGFGQHTD